MAISNYPENQDTSFESFLITNDFDVISRLGRVYTQGELRPIDYKKIMLANYAGTLANAPVRELVYLSRGATSGAINGESAAFPRLQSTNLKDVLAEAYRYWSFYMLANFSSPLGVCTDISQSVVLENPTTGLYSIQTKLKINWFVLPTSPYA